MLARPARIAFSSQPCSDRPASNFSSSAYSWRARLVSAMVPPAAPFPLSLPVFLLEFLDIAPLSPKRGLRATSPARDRRRMQTIRRSALVEHSAARMFALVNDVAAYSRRFGWCEASQV